MVFPTLTQRIQNILRKSGCKDKFLKVKRKHLILRHITNRNGTNVFHLHAKKRPAESIEIAVLVHKRLHPSHYVWIFLDFIKEYQCLSWHKRFSCISGYSEHQFLYVTSVFEYRNCFRLEKKVHLYEMQIVLTSIFPDCIRLTDLSCPCQKQSLLGRSKMFLYVFINLSVKHTFATFPRQIYVSFATFPRHFGGLSATFPIKRRERLFASGTKK